MNPIQQAPPAPPPPPRAEVGGIDPLSRSPLGREEVAALRNARSELSRQLNSASERRDELMEQLKTAPEEGRAGISERIQLLDQRLLTLEGDLQTVGRQLAMAPRQYSETQAPAAGGGGGRSFPQPFPVGMLIPLLAIFFVGTTVLRLVWNRGRKVAPVVAHNPEMDLRMERLEQAVDAVAIEVERIGEAQRYQAKLLGEGAAVPIPVAQGARVMQGRVGE